MATDVAADDHAADRSSRTSPRTESPDNSPIPHPVRRLASPSPSAQLLADASAGASTPAPNTNGTYSNNNNNNINHANGLLDRTAAASANSHNNDTGSQVIFLDADIRIPRDGRVRSAIPSKLKNVKRDLNKSFAVMQMDVSGGLKSAGRDAAAKRVSESTALQAKLASTPSYVSHHRRANWSTPPATTPQSAPPPPPPPLPPPGHPEDYVMLPLNDQEIKSEQARLLTLLRTLPPATVVDQFCKALAFFGGVPEAPPPADGRFPESVEANGPGSLFVGWVSEIFPNLERPRQPVPRSAARSLPQPVETQTSQPVTQAAVQPIKRPRGRPKGSKASKARSDKGIKKGPLKAVQKVAAAQAAADQEDSWVDEDTIMDNGQAASTSADGPSMDLSLANNAPQASSLAATQILMQGAASIETPSKKRGRPKGSKNRPKEPAPVPQAVNVNQVQENQQSELAQPVSSVPATFTAPEAPPIAITAAAGPKPKTKGKTGAVQSPAQRRKKNSTTTNTQGAPETSVGAVEVPGPKSAVELSFGTNTQPVQSDPLAPSSKAMGTHIQTPSVKESKIAGKRKRQSMPSETDGPGILNGTNAGIDASQTPASMTTQSEPTSSSAVITSVAEKRIPAKRARKGNAARASVSSAPVGNSASVGTFNATGTTASLIAGGENQLPASGAQLSDTTAPRMTGTGASGQAQHGTSTSPQIGHGQQPHKTSRSLSQTASAQRPNMPNSSNMASQQRYQQQPGRQEQAAQSQQATNRAMYYNNQALSSFPHSQQSYPNSHPQQHVSNGSPATSRGNPQVGNSPHFGAGSQSSPSIVQGDTSSFGGSPAMMHSNASQVPRRTPSASSVEAHPYRPQYGTRQQSSARTAPSVSHASPSQQNLTQSFGGYSDPLSFLDQQEDINLNNTPYNLNMDHSQSMARNSAGPSAYSSGNGMNYISQNTMARTNHQNRWQS